MFRIKYAGIHNINQHYFESNMQAGIDYDFLLFFHTPYCFGANKNETTEYSPNTIVYIPKFTPTITVLLKTPQTNYTKTVLYSFTKMIFL